MSTDQAERREAFTGLLATPVVTRAARPRLWHLVRRHRPVLDGWFADRLGYRLTVAEDTARLYRLPLDGHVVSPARPRPASRRILVLALLAAAAAEDADDLTTVQELSDRVRTLAARDDVPVSGYDPDRFSERQLFVRAVEVLSGLGVLQPTGRAGEEFLAGWAHRRDAIGGAYQVQRELLLRVVDPRSLAAAVGTRTAEPGAEDHRRFVVMRRLIELPVCLLEDLTDAERAYLASQRGRMLDWCREMTGWEAEQRREGIALIASGDEGTDRPFPRLKAEHFGALMVLGYLLDRELADSEDVRAAAAEVAARYPRALTTSFREDPADLAEAAVVILAELDLIRPADGGWRVMPVAARFRGPSVVIAQQRIEDEP